MNFDKIMLTCYVTNGLRFSKKQKQQFTMLFKKYIYFHDTMVYLPSNRNVYKLVQVVSCFSKPRFSFIIWVKMWRPYVGFVGYARTKKAGKWNGEGAQSRKVSEKTWSNVFQGQTLSEPSPAEAFVSKPALANTSFCFKLLFKIWTCWQWVTWRFSSKRSSNAMFWKKGCFQFS